MKNTTAALISLALSFAICGRLLLQMQDPRQDADSQREIAKDLEKQATDLLETIMLGDHLEDDIELVFWNFGLSTLTLARERIKRSVNNRNF